MKIILITLVGILLAACAMHSLGGDRLRLGMTKEEVDSEFAAGDTSTGNWASTLIEKQSVGGKEEAVYRYWWKRAGISIGRSALYEAVFIDGRLAAYRLVPPQASAASDSEPSGLSARCRWSIANETNYQVAQNC